MANLDWAADWAVDVDYRDRFGLVVETGSPRQIVAHAAYVRIEPDRAEVAFLVADAWQGHGIATILLAHLAERAAAAGHRDVRRRRAAGQPPDDRGLSRERLRGGRAHDAGRDPRRVPDIAVARGRRALPGARPDRLGGRGRERSRPASVAVIGASRRTRNGRRRAAAQRRRGGLHRPRVRGQRARRLDPRNRRLPLGERDPRARRPRGRGGARRPGGAAARECVAAGARALVVISAGFAEVGGAGRRSPARAAGGLPGGRASGWLAPTASACSTRAPAFGSTPRSCPVRPTPGAIAFLSQSGGLGIAIIEAAARLGVGLSSFVSVGNKADLSGNDFLQYWEQDPATDVALLYLESFGNPRKFARVARRFGQTKPIVAVKSGRSAAGLRGTASHTGALLAASDVTVDALFRQAGVIRTDTLAEMFDVAALLSKQPVPAGDRVAIVTNAGGPGHRLRRRVPGGRRAGARAVARAGVPAGSGIFPPAGVGRQPDRHDRDRVGRGLPRGRSTADRRIRRVRRDPRDLRPAAGDRRRATWRARSGDVVRGERAAARSPRCS